MAPIVSASFGFLGCCAAALLQACRPSGIGCNAFLILHFAYKL
jgi:hypothetical protein